jgi:hypothetical protein
VNRQSHDPDLGLTIQAGRLHLANLSLGAFDNIDAMQKG